MERISFTFVQNIESTVPGGDAGSISLDREAVTPVVSAESLVSILCVDLPGINGVLLETIGGGDDTGVGSTPPVDTQLPERPFVPQDPPNLASDAVLKNLALDILEATTTINTVGSLARPTLLQDQVGGESIELIDLYEEHSSIDLFCGVQKCTTDSEELEWRILRYRNEKAKVAAMAGMEELLKTTSNNNTSLGK